MNLDPVFRQQLRQHVMSQIVAVGGKIRGENAVILCPYHADSTPSLQVHVGHKVTPGVFHCFSCGAKGNWNKLASTLGLTTVDMGVGQSKDYALVSSIDPFKLLSAELGHLDEALNAKPRILEGTEELRNNFTWRGLSKEFLERFGARFFWDRKRDLDCLYFPLTIHGKYEGYTIAILNPKDKLKYLTFADTKKVFLLIDYIEAGKPIVLTEGHFDGLRLQSEGIPAVTQFGTENWGPIKRSVLLSKNPSKVLIAFDGDRAGYEASQKVFLDLREHVAVDILYLPLCEPKIDPGNMPKEWVEHLRSKLL